MRFVILAFSAGIVWLQWQSALPEPALLAALAWLGGALAVPRLRWPRAHAAAVVGAFLVGVSWAGLRAHERLADDLARASEGRDIELVGVVAGLPQRFENGLRFAFDVEQAPAGVPAHISLAWYRDGHHGWHGEEEATGPVQRVRAGERWRLVARLKRPHGNLNPHGYDYEAALLERGVRATGYVRTSERNVRQDEFVRRPGYAIERLRE